MNARRCAHEKGQRSLNVSTALSVAIVTCNNYITMRFPLASIYDILDMGGVKLNI